jgi:hypothetical protein
MAAAMVDLAVVAAAAILVMAVAVVALVTVSDLPAAVEQAVMPVLAVQEQLVILKLKRLDKAAAEVAELLEPIVAAVAVVVALAYMVKAQMANASAATGNRDLAGQVVATVAAVSDSLLTVVVVATLVVVLVLVRVLQVQADYMVVKVAAVL